MTSAGDARKINKPTGRILALALTVAATAIPGLSIGDSPSAPSGWEEVPTEPPLLVGASIAYDEVNKRAILFGGFPTECPTYHCEASDETWSWDGSVWRLLHPTVRPSPRWMASAAYDRAREKVVLFGGFTCSSRATRVYAPYPHDFFSGSSGAAAVDIEAIVGECRDLRAETWTWDGSNWAREESLVSPPPVAASSMVYDAKRQQVVLFGGCRPAWLENATCWDQYNLNTATTWTWDGGAWTPVLAAPTPSPRWAPSMTYDPVREQVLLFGGADLVTGQPLQDTWTWEGQHWEQRSPDASPTARFGAAMGFDERRGAAILYGGSESFGAAIDPATPAASAVIPPPLDDTWAWDGGTWTRTQSHAEHGIGSWHGALYDRVRQRVLLFGLSYESVEAMWEWDGIRWIPLSRRRPPQRIQGQLAFDPRHRVAILFGGYCYPVCGGTWIWDGATWRESVPDVSPPVRDQASMTYDPTTETLVLFGGFSSAGVLGDTWMWDQASETWTKALPPVSPPARSNAAMAPDHLGRLLLFGGRTCGIEGCVALRDTWMWDGRTWTYIDDAGTNMPGETTASMAFDPSRGETVLLMDNGSTFTWNGSTWSERTPLIWSETHRQRRLLYGGIAYDARRRMVVAMGGAGAERTGCQGEALHSPGISQGGGWCRSSSPEEIRGWDGNAWVTLTPAGQPGPLPRIVMGLSEEPGGGVLLFGGMDTNPGSSLSDTWVWRG